MPEPVLPYGELVEEYAALMRMHTRASHALAGNCDYPEEERYATGRRSGVMLKLARESEERGVERIVEESARLGLDVREERVYENIATPRQGTQKTLTLPVTWDTEGA